MKYKYLVCALIYVGLCSIDCYFSNVPMLNSIGQMGITEDVIFLNMHNSGSNFCGIKEILVADTIPVLLGIYYALDKEKTYILLRYKTREKYNNSQIRIIIVMAAIFSAVRQIVDYILRCIVLMVQQLRNIHLCCILLWNLLLFGFSLSRQVFLQNT